MINEEYPYFTRILLFMNMVREKEGQGQKKGRYADDVIVRVVVSLNFRNQPQL
jgi:hypothetical protein